MNTVNTSNKIMRIRYNQYKIQLAKRGKAVCSNCGKKTLVNYIYSDGTPVSDGVCGKCDRADNCGVHYPPKEYFKDNEHLNPRTYTRFHPQPQRPKINVPSYISTDVWKKSMRGYEHNPLVRFLHSIFDANAGVEIPGIVDSTVKRYGVGTSAKYGGSTVFWQIDQYGKIRSGQILGYDAITGTRDHKKQNWVHSVMSDQYPDFNLEQYFFGSHLIKRADEEMALKNAKRREMNIDGDVEPIIWLMESPKAAIILSIALTWGGEKNLFIPMATFGSEGLNPTFERKRNRYDKHQILKNRKVVLFPDNGKFEEWKSKGEILKGFSKEVYISTVMEPALHPHNIDYHIQDGDGFDDVILHYVKNGLPIWDLILGCYGCHGEWKIV